MFAATLLGRGAQVALGGVPGADVGEHERAAADEQQRRQHDADDQDREPPGHRAGERPGEM